MRRRSNGEGWFRSPLRRFRCYRQRTPKIRIKECSRPDKRADLALIEFLVSGFTLKSNVDAAHRSG
jgi:hypothetical protein